jgi:TIGR03009 family protein
MRNAGWTLTVLLLAVSIANAQPGLADVPTSTPEPATSTEVDPKLKEHLEAWEKAMSGVTNMHCKFSLKREDDVFKKSKDYTGALLFMKPNLFIWRLDYTGDPTGRDYQALICNQKSFYVYSGLEKIVTEFQLVTPIEKTATEFRPVSTKALIKEWRLQVPDLDATDEQLSRLANYLMRIRVPFHVFDMARIISGVKPRDLQQRFEFKLRKEDDNYIYLDMKPLLQSDKIAVQQIRMALFGPKSKTPYLPAQINILGSNGESENWSVTNTQTNIPGIQEDQFHFVAVPGFELRGALELPGPAPATNNPDMIAPIKPETPVLETLAPPSASPSVMECPDTPTYFYEQRFRWGLIDHVELKIGQGVRSDPTRATLQPSGTSMS